MDDKRKKLLIIAAVVCFGLFVGDRLVVSPLRSLWKSRSQAIADLDTDLTKGQLLVDREDSLRKRWAEMRKRGLPADEAAAEDAVLQAVSRWTRESGLNPSSLKKRWIGSEEKEFKRVEFTAAAQGNIAAIARFLYELERDPLAVKVEEVEITSQDDTGRQLTLGLRFSGLTMTGGVQ